LSFGTKANRYAVDGSMASTGELDIRDVDIDSNGSFEIIVSREKSDGNWLPLDQDSSILIVRQTFFERDKEQPATVRIETLGAPASPTPLSADGLSTALTKVPAFIGGTSAIFKQWAELFRHENRNALNTTDQSMFAKAGGDPMIHYLHGWWELEPHQALQIHSVIPDCEGWNCVTLTISAQKHDGNWIDTANHEKGTMLWRWTGAKVHPIPTVKIIKMD